MGLNVVNGSILRDIYNIYNIYNIYIYIFIYTCMGICICTYNCIVHNPEGGMLCDECFKGTNGRLQLQQNGTQSRKEKSTGLILQKTAAFSW